MYHKSFYITEAVGNNAFSYEKRSNKKLFVPSLKRIEDFDEVELVRPISGDRSHNKITFEDYDFDEVLQTCYGLRNLYEYNSLLNPLPWQGKGATKTKMYVVDNHNHAHYFWYLARSEGIISDGAKVYHIDAHADTRDPGEYLMNPESYDMQKVFEFTNFTLNVGNFIVPAQKEGLVGEVVQIRGEEDLYMYLGQAQDLPLQEACRDTPCGYPETQQSIILDLDLDFFAPEMEYIDFTLAKEVILDIASKADLITICTSPFFIEQERALKFLREIFT